MKQALILSGGKGTRLSSILNGLPKSLVDIGGKPLLEWQIDLLRKYGYEEIFILVGYGAAHIKEFLFGNDNFSLKNIECISESTPLGTAGAVLSIFHKLRDDFLVLYGDTMMNVDLLSFREFHLSKRSTSATLFIHPNDHPSDSDLVEIDNHNQIIAFHKYPHPENVYFSNLVSAALYYFKKDALLPWLNKISYLDFGKDIFPSLLNNGHILLGYNSFEYIKDCGTPARVEKVRKDLKTGRILKSSLAVKQKALFIDRDGTINIPNGHISKPEQFELLPNVAEAIRLVNNSEYRAIVITNQPVIARGECTFQDLKKIHNKMETLLGYEGTYLDGIYFCPHHPESGFDGEVFNLKVKCNCRKPNIGLIQRATKDFNIELKDSWFIGDSEIDIRTARNAKVKSIQVQNGYNENIISSSASPNFSFPDLYSAVKFINEAYIKLLKACQELGEKLVNRNLVLVGGLSKSGKTTLVNGLRLIFEEKGLNVLALNLDKLLTEKKVSYGSEAKVLYQFSDLLSAVNNRDFLDIVNTDFYSTSSFESTSKKFNQARRYDLLIIDGTFSLHFFNSVEFGNAYRILVQCDEVLRKKRCFDFYCVDSFESLDLLKHYESELNRFNSVSGSDLVSGGTILDLDYVFSKKC